MPVVTPMTLSCLAIAVLLLPGGVARQRLLGQRASEGARRLRRWRPRSRGTVECDPLALAAGWDLLAAALRAGLPLPVTLYAVAAELRGAAARALRETARASALGADPVTAWDAALRHPDTADLARAARRTARSGSGLADAATGLAERARAAVGQHAQSRAQRASVWVAAPLGLCFLPAFLCLGVLPVVVGMVEEITRSW